MPRLNRDMTRSSRATSLRSQHASRNGQQRPRLDESDAEKFKSGRRGGAAIAALLRADGLMAHCSEPAQHRGGEEGNAR
jgi:hypothetical protein